MTLYKKDSLKSGIVFGPVPSRRLGRSLGIDLTPHKTCSFDCIYCECGRTNNLTVDREVFIDPEKVLFELESFFNKHGEDSIDVITFSGAGEPTLYRELGFIISHIKREYSHIPVGVLTNGSLLWQDAVRNELMNADFVIPSLDAPNPVLFKRINRPHEKLRWDQYISGLKIFCSEYRGDLRLEVFLVRGVNTSSEVIEELKSLLLEVNPPVVELNTLVRPGTEESVTGLDAYKMQEIARSLMPIRCNVIGQYLKKNVVNTTLNELDSEIVRILIRRPCTLDEMADSLGVPLQRLKGAIERLCQENKVHRVGNFYFAGEERKFSGTV